MNQWRENSRRQRRGEQICARVLKHWSKRTCATAFEGWKWHASQQRAMNDRCARIVIKLMNRSLDLAFCSWKENSQRRQRTRDISSRVLRRWVQRSMAAGFGSWVSFTFFWAKKVRMLHSRAAGRSKISSQARAFNWWAVLASMSLCLPLRRQQRLGRTRQRALTKAEARYARNASVPRLGPSADEQLIQRVEAMWNQRLQDYWQTIEKHAFEELQRIWQNAVGEALQGELERVRGKSPLLQGTPPPLYSTSEGTQVSEAPGSVADWLDISHSKSCGVNGQYKYADALFCLALVRASERGQCVRELLLQGGRCMLVGFPWL
jgi:hypothetical protein